MGSASKKDSEIDWISKLPEDIHHEILSHLSTNDAIKTSVLSRSWRHKWTSLTNLDLINPINIESFNDFINRITKTRSLPFVKRFKLTLKRTYSCSTVESWIDAVIAYKIQELDLCNITCIPVRIPDCLFRCESLQVLKLGGLGCYEIPKTTFFLPNLKILRLRSVRYLSESTLEGLLSSSRNLEELVLYNYFKTKTLYVRSSSLKVLKIQMRNHLMMETTRVVIDAPQLEFLEFGSNDRRVVEIETNNLCSIVDVVLNLDLLLHCSIVQFLTNISKTVKALTLSPNILEDLFYASNTYMPSFPNLNQLVVSLFESGTSDLLNMLRILPNLKVLTLIRNVYRRVFSSESWDDEQNAVPQCLTSSVERFVFNGYSCCPIDVKMLEYVLKNAKVLKEIFIIAVCIKSSEEPVKEVLLNKLSVLPECRVKIEYARSYEMYVDLSL